MRSPARLVRDWRSIGMAVLATLCFGAASASAATLNVVGGILYGASGVIVDGSSYNVEFLDGTCIALYNGCDDVSDFTFQTNAAAVLASQALLDQVFLDGVLGDFDSDPSLTNTCHGQTDHCSASTPWGFSSFGFNVSIVLAANAMINVFDTGFANTGNGISDDFSTFSDRVFAVWSPVPEPNTALLLSLGLTGLAARRRSLRS